MRGEEAGLVHNLSDIGSLLGSPSGKHSVHTLLLLACDWARFDALGLVLDTGRHRGHKQWDIGLRSATRFRRD